MTYQHLQEQSKTLLLPCLVNEVAAVNEKLSSLFSPFPREGLQ